MFPDKQSLKTIDVIRAKSEVLHLGVDLNKMSLRKPASVKNKKPLILWNHRWEYDKNPEDFVNALITLKNRNINFDVAFLGECFNKVPEIFLKVKNRLLFHERSFPYLSLFL